LDFRGTRSGPNSVVANEKVGIEKTETIAIVATANIQ
jgi:hypothetical protein